MFLLSRIFATRSLAEDDGDRVGGAATSPPSFGGTTTGKGVPLSNVARRSRIFSKVARPSDAAADVGDRGGTALAVCADEADESSKKDFFVLA